MGLRQGSPAAISTIALANRDDSLPFSFLPSHSPPFILSIASRSALFLCAHLFGCAACLTTALVIILLALPPQYRSHALLHGPRRGAPGPRQCAGHGCLWAVQGPVPELHG